MGRCRRHTATEGSWAVIVVGFLTPCVCEMVQDAQTGGCSNSRPSLDLSPLTPEAQACGGARAESGVFANPNSCEGRPRTTRKGWKMAQMVPTAGIDVCKD